jgi:hypothetical protein
MQYFLKLILQNFIILEDAMTEYSLAQKYPDGLTCNHYLPLKLLPSRKVALLMHAPLVCPSKAPLQHAN